MPRLASIRCSTPARIAAVLIVLLTCVCITAQTAATGGSQDSAEPETPLLRTYVNLVQIPVLVLDSRRQPRDPVDPARFRIRLDSGPKFASRHVRREGADPLRLVVMLDENGADRQAAADFNSAIGALAEPVLQPQDRLSIEVTQGCTFSRSSSFPAMSAAKLTEVTATVMQKAYAAHTTVDQQHHGCPDRSHLWDSMANAVLEMKDNPGRKVLLVVSDGFDGASKTTPLKLKEWATDHSVTIFALRRSRPRERSFTSFDSNGLQFPTVFRLEGDPLTMMCELTGGMVLEGQSLPLARELAYVISLIRGRYIIDFVRPSALERGSHSIDVSIGDKQAFVRAGGTSVPLPDATELNDPSRLPSDPTIEPPVGTRRVLK